MAIFGSVKAIVQNVNTTIYTAPTNGAILIGLFIANKTVDDHAVTITCSSYYLGKEIPVRTNATVNAIDGRIFLSNTETVNIFADASNSLDVILSYMEI